MRKYRQLTSGERYAIAALKRQGYTKAEMARALGRHPSTIGRELRRNERSGGAYVALVADQMCRARRSRSRRNRRFTAEDWALVVAHLEEEWSPEQIAGRLKRRGKLRISHETIYWHIWEDRRGGGQLYRHLRGAQKKRRKRYGRYDSRGRLAGKRPISERPPGAENRSRVGHLEGDTMIGSADKHCVLTLVDRKTGYLMLGKLEARTTKATNRRAIKLIRRAQRDRVPRLQGRRGRDRSPHLLRDASPLVGAGDLREHQRVAPPVPTQEEEHRTCLPGRLQPHRPPAQQPPPQTTRLSHSSGML